MSEGIRKMLKMVLITAVVMKVIVIFIATKISVIPIVIAVITSLCYW